MSEADHGASLELSGVKKHYGDVAALDGISLTIPAGEFVTLLGPSGSGKTTTLNMIAGFVEPDAGEISMAGRPIAELPPHRRNLGMVFQSYALFPHMTVAGNVAFPLKQRRRSKSEIASAVDDALRLVGLQGLGGRYPRELSGGQQQRVALARALVFHPQVLLMDEPLGALDKHLRESLQLEFRRIHRELGITFVYVTHDQEEALVLSDRIAVFRQGRIEQMGTAEDLYERPASLFVARFLGDSNILPGRLATKDGTPVVIGEHGELAAPRRPADCEESAPCALVIRPERMRLRPIAAGLHEDGNVLRGTIGEVIYMGSARRLNVHVGPSLRLTVREQAGRTSSAGQGDEILVEWDRDDAVLLPHDGDELAGDGSLVIDDPQSAATGAEDAPAGRGG